MAKNKNDNNLKNLSLLQLEVTKQNATEKPFTNKFCHHKETGIYICLISKEPLFSSLHKYDSGSGWPSFTTPLVKENIEILEDLSHGLKRLEVRSIPGDSHLGHLFDDGPAPLRTRYCINSASLDFVPLENFKQYNFERFLHLF